MQFRKTLATIAIASTLTIASCGSEVTDPSTNNVKQPEKAATETRASGPMPDGAFKASISVPEPAPTRQPGQKQTITVKIKNIGDTVWPSRGRAADGFFQVNVGDIWTNAEGKRVEGHPYVRSPLPADVTPGQEVEVPLAITAPTTKGEYTLMIDLVQEMVAWFHEKGNGSPKYKIKVQ
jgi:hypothetical protein